MQEAIKKLNVDPKRVNIGIVGLTGSGKSTFINSFLGLEGNAAAPTGPVQTTHVAKEYKSKTSSLSLWDLPGAGTRDHPLETYYEDKGLLAFEGIVIMMKDRVHEADLQFAKTLLGHNKRICFLRSFADEDLDIAAADFYGCRKGGELPGTFPDQLAAEPFGNATNKTDFRKVPTDVQQDLKTRFRETVTKDFEKELQ